LPVPVLGMGYLARKRNQTMIYRLLLACFVWAILSIPSQGQRYFSNLYPFDQGTHRFLSIEQVDSVDLRESEKVASAENKTLVYPNPSDGLFTIIPNSKTFHTGKPLDIQVYDITGHRVFESQQLISQASSFQILLPDVSKGMYLLYIKQQGVQETVKIIKQ